VSYQWALSIPDLDSIALARGPGGHPWETLCVSVPVTVCRLPTLDLRWCPWVAFTVTT
jgi:hypothetical protein